MAKHAARCTDWIAQHELQMRKVYGRDCQGRHGGRLQEMPIDGPLHGGATTTPKPRVRVGTAEEAAKEEHGVGGGRRGTSGRARALFDSVHVHVHVRQRKKHQHKGLYLGWGRALANAPLRDYLFTCDYAINYSRVMKARRRKEVLGA